MIVASERASLGRLGAAAVAIAVAGLALGLAAGDSGLGLTLAAGDGASIGEALSIFARNTCVAALALLIALAARTFEGRAGRVLDLIAAAIAAFNVFALSAAVGALGTPVLERIAAHAPFELAGFGCFALAYLRLRRGGSAAELAGPVAVGLALLAGAALLESFVGGEV